ncbi:MAG: adenylate/guanylate cyclase domain-containing protein [Granulosicoccaceae bacterium]
MPITVTLAAAIGLLVLVTVGVVFGVGVWLAQKNTFDLLSANARQAIAADVNQVEQHLRPAEHQAQFLVDQIASSEIDPTNREHFGNMLIGALAGAPQIEAVMFIDTQLQSLVAGRDAGGTEVGLNVLDYSDDLVVRQNIEDALQGPVWNPPIWRERFQGTYLNRVHPVRRDGVLIGAIVAVVSVQHLSGFISEEGLETTGNRFILYGRDHVLAHWLMMSGYPDRSSEHPLPRLNEFGDPVLASIWQREGRHELVLNLPAGTDGHVLEIFNDGYAFLYRRLVGFGPHPMIVGTYFQADDYGKEVQRMIAALFAGIAALIVSLIAAVILGRRIARPIVRFSGAASRIGDLDVSKIEELPGSMLRELNNQSIAFNSMLRALRWFELYVPKKIVARLIKEGDVIETISDAREITIMFTDIVGFSAVSEGMLAPEVAAFVNHHFSLVADCIENEEGTIDKFMGDAVMAFWGAPDSQSDSAERACRAACAIAATIREDNRRRTANGEPSVGIRIGIHTGIATVGNIGAPGRLNYTMIGDAVNIGQRLEQLGKKIFPAGTDVSILLSDDTASKLGPEFKTVAAGRYKLEGRMGEIGVFKLDGLEGIISSE